MRHSNANKRSIGNKYVCALELYRVEKTGSTYAIGKFGEFGSDEKFDLEGCKEESRWTMWAAGIDEGSRFSVFIREFVFELIFEDALTGHKRVELFFKCLITIGALDGNEKVESKPYLDCFASELSAMLNNTHKDFDENLNAVSEHIFNLIDTLRTIPTSNAPTNQ